MRTRIVCLMKRVLDLMRLLTTATYRKQIKTDCFAGVGDL